MTLINDRIRAAFIGAMAIVIAMAAVAMLTACARNDSASVASPAKQDAMIVAQADPQAVSAPEEMPEVVVRAAR